MSKSEKIIAFNSIELAIIIILILLSIFSPFIFSSKYIINYFSITSTTAEIGDAIGGITAPFIGLLAAYLVYKSFIAQIEANKKQMVFITQELHYSYITNITNEVLNLFDKLHIYSYYLEKEVNGVKSVTAFVENIPVVTHLKNNNTETPTQDKLLYDYLRKLNQYVKNILPVKQILIKSSIPDDIKNIKLDLLKGNVKDIINADLIKLDGMELNIFGDHFMLLYETLKTNYIKVIS